MANTFVVSRNHLILGLCLPLAILLGYLLAEPLDSTSLAIVVLVLAVLSVPVLMRWYHPLLIASWNAAITPYFLPGQPSLWIVIGFLGLLFALLNRSVNPAHGFLHVPEISLPLVALLLVVVATALMTGGFGMRTLGSDSYGGKGYFYVLAAIVGYFTLTSRPIPLPRAPLCVALFFLSGLTAGVSHLVYLAGPKFYFLYEFFPVSAAIVQAAAEYSLDGSMVRLGGMVGVALSVYCFVLARYGIAGVFDFTRPWRLTLFLGAIFAGMYGGFRSILLLMGFIFAALFFLERLWKTKIFVILIIVGTLIGVLLGGFAERLPLSVQRAISFLPVKIDPLTRQNALDSTEWRLEMWRTVLPLVPQYLLKGKGYALSPNDIYLVGESTLRGHAATWESAALAGDYHNGPLSVIIPFGIYGIIAFVWFLWAGGRYLVQSFRHGRPELSRINTFLLALFLARILYFCLIFGAFYSELFYFTGILGVSVALNSGGARAAVTDEEPIANEIGWSRRPGR